MDAENTVIFYARAMYRYAQKELREMEAGSDRAGSGTQVERAAERF